MKNIFIVVLIILTITSCQNKAKIHTQQASPNLLGFDTDTKLSAELAEQFQDKGYHFCIRYLSLSSEEAQYDLTEEEAEEILKSGLALIAVQHVLQAGWMPSKTLGSYHGKDAAQNAEAIGLPKGMNIWCDLESVGINATPEQVMEYCNAWYDAVKEGGYRPGLYVGPAIILKNMDLDKLKFKHYWKSASKYIPKPQEGWQLEQFAPESVVNGIHIDKDKTQINKKGQSLYWAIYGKTSFLGL